ncbi:MAG: exodeoxyribonuclease V subunit gamma [Proteobacteria bacterium]|nr:exodeoxyribonuclease V subunit gamma [Pseudomonadota bacterium]
MGFHLIHGNDADALLERLAARLRTPDPAAGPLDPEIVLVPQFGLRRWLEIRLAEKLGIIANIDFVAPAEYVWRLLRAANPGLDEISPFDPRLLPWRIFSALPALREGTGSAELAALLGDGSQRACLRLAQQIAHMFERYLAYDRELLQRWERGDDIRDWQAVLWRRLVQEAKESHRATLIDAYVRRHRDGAARPPGLPARLFAFACTNISRDLLGLFGAVAQHCELDFLVPNPCREFWGDVPTVREALRTGADAPGDDNPLLMACARGGRLFFDQLYEYDLVQPNEETDVSRPPGRDTLLHRVQSDVLERAPPRAAGLPADGSIEFHVAHSRLREVEALHDRLLDLFQRDATLRPRDVAIMSPDIAAYAPYIEAVFGGVPRGDPRHLPYALSDASARDAHPLVAFALKLFALPLERFSLAAIVEWLAMPALMRRFGLDASQLEHLGAWLAEAGVRWGLDAAQHAQFGAGAYREFSWEFGIERLLLGYASGAGVDLIAGAAPLPLIEGSATQALDALLRVLAVLRRLLAAQRGLRSATEWQKTCNEAIDALLDVEADDREATSALDAIRAALAALADDAREAGSNEPLDWACVHDFVAARLAEPQRSYRFFGGGINVCGMLPLRVVPFRVICLIGMNDDAFPRRDVALALNRMPPGKARSDRDDDRYLFLQLLCAARDRFHMSWIGEDQRDGGAREPSSVVAELLDILARQYFDDAGEARRRLVTKHPLQPFSPRYFDESSSSSLFTYRGEWRRAAQSERGGAVLAPFVDANFAGGEDVDAIDVDELRKFLRGPARRFFVDRAGMHFVAPDEQLADADALELRGLERFRIVEALTGRLVDEPAGTDFSRAAFWRAQGLLPAGWAGETAFVRARAAAQALAQELAILRGGATGATTGEAMPDLTLASGMRLQGNLPALRDGRLLRWRGGSQRPVDRLSAWIDHLSYAARGRAVPSVLLGWDRGKQAIDIVRWPPLAAAAANEHLDVLVQIHRLGQTRPLLFFPQASFSFAQALREAPDDTDKALSEACRKFHPQDFASSPGRSESEDPANALAVRGRDPFAPGTPAAREFAELALATYAPMLAAGEDAP